MFLARVCGALALLALGLGTPASANPADTLLLNGKIVTLDGTSQVSEALAIEAGRIAATGSTDAMRKLAGPATQIIDLDGRTVIPGLIDSHIHAIRAGFRYATEVHWDGATDIAQAMERLKSAAAHTRPGAWLIVAGGWSARQFTESRRPTQAEVDAVAGGETRPTPLFFF